VASSSRCTLIEWQGEGMGSYLERLSRSAHFIIMTKGMYNYRWDKVESLEKKEEAPIPGSHWV